MLFYLHPPITSYSHPPTIHTGRRSGGRTPLLCCRNSTCHSTRPPSRCVCYSIHAPPPRHLRSLFSAGGGFFVWSFVVFFLSCRVLCCGVLVDVCVCDLFLYLHLSCTPSYSQEEEMIRMKLLEDIVSLMHTSYSHHRRKRVLFTPLIHTLVFTGGGDDFNGAARGHRLAIRGRLWCCSCCVFVCVTCFLRTARIQFSIPC